MQGRELLDHLGAALGIGAVVLDDQLDRTPADPAALVDVGDGGVRDALVPAPVGRADAGAVRLEAEPEGGVGRPVHVSAPERAERQGGERTGGGRAAEQAPAGRGRDARGRVRRGRPAGVGAQAGAGVGAGGETGVGAGDSVVFGARCHRAVPRRSPGVGPGRSRTRWHGTARRSSVARTSPRTRPRRWWGEGFGVRAGRRRARRRAARRRRHRRAGPPRRRPRRDR